MKITKKPVEEAPYPLAVSILVPKRLYECENGTVVILLALQDSERKLNLNLEYENKHVRIINILNGLGGYLPSNKFKVLPNVILELETDKYGNIS